MATKKSVLLLCEFENVFAELESDADRSALIMAIFAYSFRGEEPDFTGVLRYAWRSHIKPKLDEMHANYDKKCNTLREAANKRWQMQKDANACKSIQKDANADDKDKDKDKDKDILSNIQTTSNKDIEKAVDNSVDNLNSQNAQQNFDNSPQKSLDGLDFYKLDEKNAFEAFRNFYPRRQGALRDVQTAWVTATVGSHILPGDLVMAAKRYAAECERLGTEMKFIKMPQNFISDGTWKQYAPKFLPICVDCHGTGVYEVNGNMIMCGCDRRYAP